MKAKLDCIPCMFNQAYRASKTATTDEKLIREVLNRAGKLVEEIDLSLTPPEAAMPIYKLVEKVTGNSDPYQFEKIKHIKAALQLYPLMKEKVRSAENSLQEAIKIAIAGNAIDLGSTLESIDVKAQFEEMDKSKFVLNHFEEFQARLKDTNSVLFLADNAGETVFDRPLIEELVNLKKNVIYAVKEKPIINDATYEDAVLSGISCRIVSTGSGIAGTVISSCSEDFRHLLYNAKLVIAKGQGNYETLSDEDIPIFFLFKVKCNPISEDTGFPVGSMLLLKSKNFIE